MKLLIALPCFNEGKTIAGVLTSIPREFAGVDEVRLLVVDDGSADDTAEAALQSGAMVIRHKENKGLGQAFRSGVEYAIEHGFDLMVNMDGDGQFDPQDIHRLIKPILDQRADFVSGSRFLEQGKIQHMPLIKRWGNNRMTRLVSRLCHKKFTDVSCGFRAYNRDALLKINFHGRFTYTQESFVFFHFNNMTMAEEKVSVKYFPGRKSRIAGSIVKYARRTAGILIGIQRDYYPMRFFSIIGIGFSIPALVFGLMFLIHYLTVGYFRDYLFAGLLSAFCALIAMLMFSFGLAMESMVRINRNQNRILYLQRKEAEIRPEGDLRIIIR